MKKLYLLLILFVVFFNNSFAQTIKVETIEWKGERLEIVEGEFVFKLKESKGRTDFSNLIDNFKGIILKKSIDDNNVGLMKFESKINYSNNVKNLERSGIFKFIYPNTIDRAFVIPDDDYVSNQYALTNLDLYQTWEISKGNSAIKIGILDSGIPIQNGNLSHNDLNDNNRYLFGADIVGDGNGVKDENGHGTHVSGIVGALTDNSNGIAGSNWHSNLYICQVFANDGTGSSYNFYHGVKNAVDNGCKVINYSGGGSANPLKVSAIIYAQNHSVLLVVAAGNNHGGSVEYPGAYANQYDNLICVSATDVNDKFADFSSSGSTVTVSAPGGNIYSTMPNYTVYLNSDGYSQNYDYMDGTSMATPYITGVASLIYSQNPNYSPSQVKQILIESADDIQYYESGFPIWPFDDWEVGVGRDNYTGYGRVNAFKAVSGLLYKLTLNNSPTGKNGLSVGDYVKIWDLAGHYIGRVTISNNMIAPDGYWRWNGLVDDGKYNFANGMYIGLKNGSGSSLQIILQGDNIPPSGSGFSFVNSSRFKVSISEYFNVVWVTAFVFDANGNFVRKDFEERISNAGNNKYFNLNSSLSNGQILKAFIVDNAGNVNSISKQYIQIPLSVNISGPTSLGYNELGYFTANPSGGSGAYTNYRWWSRDDDGFIPEKTSFDEDGSGKDGNTIRRPPPNVWIEMTQWEGEQTISKSSPVDFSLKCEVTDSDNNTTTDIHSVNVGGFLSKAQSEKAEIAVLAVPENVELTGNYPNPFNPSTSIKFGLPEDSHVKLKIYSITGQKIISLADGSYLRGYHEIKWDGKNQAGNYVSNGIYIYELRTGYHRLVKKMVFAK